MAKQRPFKMPQLGFVQRFEGTRLSAQNSGRQWFINFTSSQIIKWANIHPASIRAVLPPSTTYLGQDNNMLIHNMSPSFFQLKRMHRYSHCPFCPSLKKYLASAFFPPFFPSLDRLGCADIEETRHCLGVVACPISRAIWHLDHRQTMPWTCGDSMNFPCNGHENPLETTYKRWMDLYAGGHGKLLRWVWKFDRGC